METLLDLANQQKPNEPQATVAISYLINQHRKEILDVNSDINQVLKLSFNTEFQNMIQVCIFVPFLHEETPKPVNVNKVVQTKDNENALMN